VMNWQDGLAFNQLNVGMPPSCSMHERFEPLHAVVFVACVADVLVFSLGELEQGFNQGSGDTSLSMQTMSRDVGQAERAGSAPRRLRQGNEPSDSGLKNMMSFFNCFVPGYMNCLSSRVRVEVEFRTCLLLGNCQIGHVERPLCVV
jgi:hypothetical protein